MNITNPKVSDYINLYYKPLNSKLCELRKISELARIPIILKETEIFLHSVLLLKNPKKILEIGTANGYSASFFAELLPKSSVVTIESCKERYDDAIKNFENLNIQNRITAYLGKGEEVLKDLQLKGERDFDFVFIDAAKSKYLEFFNESIKMCRHDAMVISDNVLLRAMVASDEFDTKNRYKTNIRHLRKYVKVLSEDPNHHTGIFAVGDGIAMTQLDFNN